MPGGDVDHQVTQCNGTTYACGDGIDNDLDGLVDSVDPECAGACDAYEDEFRTGIESEIDVCASDCEFDGTSGPGDDTCHWDRSCDPLSPGGSLCPYDARMVRCAGLLDQSAKCKSACEPLTPNGCDCFGCCELPRGSSNFVWMKSFGCSMATATDPTICEPCTQVPSCRNECSPEEVCVGNEAPEMCGPGQCPEGVERCGLSGQSACPEGSYCVTGCCRAMPVSG